MSEFVGGLLSGIVSCDQGFFKVVGFVLLVVAIKYLSKWGVMWWKLSRKSLR